MLGKANILMIAELFILSHVSCVLSRQLSKESLESERYYQQLLRDIPMMREVFYLPEEDYNAENTVNELKQLDRDNRNLIPEYRKLCKTVTRTVELNNPDSEYQYHPSNYQEIFCESDSPLANDEQIMMRPSQQTCVHPGFHCVQRSRMLFLARRRWDSQCWEPHTKEIASGCDCMWPVATLSEITHHY